MVSFCVLNEIVKWLTQGVIQTHCIHEGAKNKEYTIFEERVLTLKRIYGWKNTNIKKINLIEQIKLFISALFLILDFYLRRL